MTTTDYAQTILEVKKGAPSSPAVDETAAFSADNGNDKMNKRDN